MTVRPPKLETRVTARKAELIAEIIEYKMNSSRAGAAEAIDRIKVRLSELAHIENESVGTGGPQAKARLTEWMAR